MRLDGDSLNLVTHALQLVISESSSTDHELSLSVHVTGRCRLSLPQ